MPPLLSSHSATSLSSLSSSSTVRTFADDEATPQQLQPQQPQDNEMRSPPPPLAAASPLVVVDQEQQQQQPLARVVQQQQQQQQTLRSNHPNSPNSPHSQQEPQQPPQRRSQPPRQLWWQKSVVQRSASSIQVAVEAAMQKGSFLQAEPPQAQVASHALLDRSEIVLAPRPVGAGAFSVVHEVVGFALDERISCTLSAEQQAARQQLVETCLDPATGRGRYVVKHLHADLLYRKTEYTAAAVDLAVEAAYLQRLQHDNVVQLRGLPVAGLSALYEAGRHDGYFLLLDRLEETLEERIHAWTIQQQAVTTSSPSFDEQQQHDDDDDDIHQDELDLLQTKTDYAIQLARAVDYLHQQGLLFRDLKPHNIGFDSTGTLKLFDFGLCRQLPESVNHDPHAVFSMSGVGTRRYMAPEIINSGHYNQKADVYSWSMLIWQMLALEKPYAEYCLHQHRIHVCQQGERPAKLLRADSSSNQHLDAFYRQVDDLLQHCWCESVRDRFTMARTLPYLARAAALLTPPPPQEEEPVSLPAMPLSPTHSVATVQTHQGIEAVVVLATPPLPLPTKTACCTLDRRDTDATRLMSEDDSQSSESSQDDRSDVDTQRDHDDDIDNSWLPRLRTTRTNLTNTAPLPPASPPRRSLPSILTSSSSSAAKFLDFLALPRLDSHQPTLLVECFSASTDDDDDIVEDDALSVVLPPCKPNDTTMGGAAAPPSVVPPAPPMPLRRSVQHAVSA